jgi:short-subunit dehydrogenase
MASRKTAVVVGGSSGIGLAVARALATRGEAVWVTSRDPAKAEAAAGKVGHGATTIVVDLAKPHEIAERFAAVGPVDHLVITAVDRDRNSVKAYDIAAALKLVTTKLVGYAEVAHIFVDGSPPTPRSCSMAEWRAIGPIRVRRRSVQSMAASPA